jgi:serine/threonine protein phosphatase PrpC
VPACSTGRTGPGVAGSGQDIFNWPSDVVVEMNGDIFIADGHGGKSNGRIAGKNLC